MSFEALVDSHKRKLIQLRSCYAESAAPENAGSEGTESSGPAAPSRVEPSQSVEAFSTSAGFICRFPMVPTWHHLPGS